jgi:hypothetical protein
VLLTDAKMLKMDVENYSTTSKKSRINITISLDTGNSNPRAPNQMSTPPPYSLGPDTLNSGATLKSGPRHRTNRLQLRQLPLQKERPRRHHFAKAFAAETPCCRKACAAETPAMLHGCLQKQLSYQSVPTFSSACLALRCPCSAMPLVTLPTHVLEQQHRQDTQALHVFPEQHRQHGTFLWVKFY